MHSDALLSGVIEGFYGLPWSPAQRRQLFQWMRAAGVDTYVYGPKDDPHHRVRWRECYAGPLLDEVAALIQDCSRAGLRFLYAIGPGLDIRYSDPLEIAALEQRFQQLSDLGCRDVALLFDDLPSRMAPEDATLFNSFAQAQCHVANNLYERHPSREHGGRFLFCPTEYCGRMARPSVTESPYLREIGTGLHPGIDIFWTGPEIISTEISIESIREVSAVLRRPPVIWDNLHANDYDMRRLYLGPYSGRPAALRGEIRGVLTNPNCQFHANFVAVRTLGEWLRCGAEWPAEAAYQAALEAWLPEFASDAAHPITREDLEWLGDTYHLPDRNGPRAEQFLVDLAFLLSNPPSSWADVWPRFERGGAAMIRLYDHLTALANRELLHAFYRHIWELKEETLLVLAFLHWRRDNPGANGGFRAPEFRPRIFRGGFTAELAQLLPMDPTGAIVARPSGRSADAPSL